MDNSSDTNLSSIPHNVTLTQYPDLLNILTWMSCGLTCLSCLCTVMIYIGYRLLQSSRCMLRISFLTMLCTTEAFFVAGMKFTDLTAICTAMAAILHFSSIATFTWLLCYILFLGSELKGGHLSYFLFAMIGYMVPACIVTITLIWHYTDYRDNSYCWISSHNYLDWTLKGPIVTLVLLCCVILLHVLVLTVSMTSEKEKSIKKLTRSGVRACCVILPVTSATWILGAFTVTDRKHHMWLQATFTACNLLLGMVIFLVMCVFNGEVQEVRRMKHMGAVSGKRHQHNNNNNGKTVRRGINVIHTARDILRTQTPLPSPRQGHYHPLSRSTSDLLDSDTQAAPLASVEDVTLGSTELLDMSPLKGSEQLVGGDKVDLSERGVGSGGGEISTGGTTEVLSEDL